MTTGFTCPYCAASDNIVAIYSENDPVAKGGYALYQCNECMSPFLTKSVFVIETTVHRIEGIEPKNRSPVISSMEEVKQDIEEYSGTQPDEEQYHCPECGCLYPIGFKENRKDETMCSSCWAERDNAKMKKHNATTMVDNYFQVKGTANLEARFDDNDSVHLRYRGHNCDAWDCGLLDGMVVLNAAKRSDELDSLTKGLKNRIEKRTAINQFVLALQRGDVVLPEVTA